VVGTGHLVAAFALLWLLPATADACPRIVSQSPYITHTLTWLGLGDCIVGVSRYDTLDRPHTGGVMDPDAKALAELSPDLWFTSRWTAEETVAAATPPGARALRLHGLGSMQEIEDNLRIVSAAAGLPDGDARAAEFAADWRRKARAVQGNGTRVLLFVACDAAPYSFGRGSWLFELFTEAGFAVVEDRPHVRNLPADDAPTALKALIDELQPQLLFVFRQDAAQCPLAAARPGLPIVPLEGAQFLHAAPTLLDGLDALALQRAAWRGPGR
jgi:ABC-type Fe3+-hydroxamate transport system substrate-binding protein